MHLPDTVYLQAGQYLEFMGKTIHAIQDTMIILPEQVSYKISPVSFDRSQNFYDSLEAKASRTKVTSEIYKMLFLPPAKTRLPDTVEIIQSEDPYLPYAGKKIRYIFFRKMDVFGPTIQDTSRKASSWLGKQANKLHIKTRDFVIRENLLFDRGEAVEPYIIAENERLLRELPFIDNANIVINDVRGDSVDIYVITKDLFPYGVGFTASSVKHAQLKVWNENFAGLGHQVSTTIGIYSDTNPSFRIERGEYRVENIAGSFIAARAWFEQDNYLERYAIQLKRDLIPYKVRFAGGVSYYNTANKVRISGDDQSMVLYPLLYNMYDLYFGHDFEFFNPSPDNGRETFLVGMARFTLLDYMNRPYVSRDSNLKYHAYTRFLGSIGITNNKYYSSKYLYEYGRTEDIPYGYKFVLTAGYEWGEYFKRTYAGITTSAGNYLDRFGYLSANFALGGYFRNGVYEQGALKGGVSYISNLMHIKNTQVRNFLNLNFIKGVRRAGDSYVSLDDESGFMDISEGLITGEQRMVLSYNAIFYLPLYVYGFRFSAFSFFDLGFIGDNGRPVIDQSFYSSFGLGVRFKNENLVIDAIEIRLTYYPQLIPGYDQLELKFQGEGIRRIENYKIGQPSVIIYR